MKWSNRGEVVTVVSLAMVAILGIATIASSFFVNKSAKTQSTKAAEKVGFCVAQPSGSNYPSIDSNSIYKWQAYCDAPACSQNDYEEKKANSQCNQILAQKLRDLGYPADHPTWCYGFGGTKNSSADWRCMLMLIPPTSEPQQPPPQNNCYALRPPTGGPQPKCSAFGDKLVAKDNFLWRIASCGGAECTSAGSGEWCYGFADGNRKMTYVGAIGTCNVQDIAGEPAPQQPPPPQNPPQDPVNPPQQDPVQDDPNQQDPVNPPPQQPPQQNPPRQNPPKPNDPVEKTTECEAKGYVCLESANANVGYRSNNFSCDSNLLKCYEKIKQCANGRGVCANAQQQCLGTQVPGTSLENASCATGVCCVPKTDPICKKNGGTCVNRAYCDEGFEKSNDTNYNQSCRDSVGPAAQCCMPKRGAQPPPPKTSPVSNGETEPPGQPPALPPAPPQEQPQCVKQICSRPNASIAYFENKGTNQGNYFYANQADCQSGKNKIDKYSGTTTKINKWCNDQTRIVTLTIHINAARFPDYLNQQYHQTNPIKIEKIVERDNTLDYYNFGDTTFTLEQLKNTGGILTFSYPLNLSYTDIGLEEQDSFGLVFRSKNTNSNTRIYFQSTKVNWNSNTLDMYLKM